MMIAGAVGKPGRLATGPVGPTVRRDDSHGFRGGSVTLLVVGLILFIGIRVVPAFPPARAGLAGGLGENGYKILFSVVSLAGLVLACIGYGQAPQTQVFEPSQTARAFLPAAMAIAFVLVALGNLPGRIRHLVQHPMLAG